MAWHVKTMPFPGARDEPAWNWMGLHSHGFPFYVLPGEIFQHELMLIWSQSPPKSDHVGSGIPQLDHAGELRPSKLCWSLSPVQLWSKTCIMSMSHHFRKRVVICCSHQRSRLEANHNHRCNPIYHNHRRQFRCINDNPDNPDVMTRPELQHASTNLTYPPCGRHWGRRGGTGDHGGPRDLLSPVGGRAAWTVEMHHVMNIPADLLYLFVDLSSGQVGSPQVRQSKWPQVAARASGRKWPQVAAFAKIKFVPFCTVSETSVFDWKPQVLIFKLYLTRTQPVLNPY